MYSFQNAIASICCLACLGVGVGSVQAEPEETVSAVRKDPRSISNTTGWMPKAGEMHVDLGIDQKKRPSGAVSVGLGGIGEFGLQLQHERSECEPCEEVATDSTGLNLASAFFKMGTPEGLGHEQVPAFALVYRKALFRKAQILTDSDKIISRPVLKTRSAMLTAMASKSIGPTALHVGAELLVVEGTALQGDFGVDEFVVRPALGMQWSPAKYPLSTFLVDLRWVSEAVANNNAEFEWDTRMTAAWGVRYQALDWAAVDLNVRRQDGEGLDDARVTLGVRGTFDLTSSKSYTLGKRKSE